MVLSFRFPVYLPRTMYVCIYKKHVIHYTMHFIHKHTHTETYFLYTYTTRHNYTHKEELHATSRKKSFSNETHAINSQPVDPSVRFTCMRRANVYVCRCSFYTYMYILFFSLFLPLSLSLSLSLYIYGVVGACCCCSNCFVSTLGVCSIII